MQGVAGSGRAGSARGLAGWCLLQPLHWVPTEGPHLLPHLLPVVARSVKSRFWSEAPAASTQPFISLCTCHPELRAGVSSPGSQGVLSAEYRLLWRLPERGRDWGRAGGQHMEEAAAPLARHLAGPPIMPSLFPVSVAMEWPLGSAVSGGGPSGVWCWAVGLVREGQLGTVGAWGGSLEELGTSGLHHPLGQQHLQECASALGCLDQAPQTTHE